MVRFGKVLLSKSMLAGYLPALLLPIASTNDCFAVQAPSFSPPPTQISRPLPARDQATASFTRSTPSSVSRYAPPVHIQPPTAPGQRYSGAAVGGRTANGRYNTTQHYSPSPKATVARLSDQSLAATAPRVARNLQYAQPVAAAPATPRGPMRRVGLQDRIATAFGRDQNVSGEPTPAVPPVMETRVASRSQKPTKTSREFGQELARAEQTRRSRHVRSLQDQSYQRADVYLAHREVADEDYDALEADIQFATEVDDFDDRADSRVALTAAQRPVDRLPALDLEPIDEEIPMLAMAAPLQSRASRQRDVRPTVKQRSRPRSSQSRGRTRQVSVLSQESGADSPTRQSAERNGLRPQEDNDFGFGGRDESPRSRSQRSLDKIEDFEPIQDDEESLDDADEEGMDDLDDLDDDIDAELERNRRRKNDDIDDEDLDEDDEDVAKPPVTSCEEFRNELLSGTIRDIPLDISPPKSTLPGSYASIARSWTDRSGNVIATGGMQDMRRGYVILDSGQKIAYARLSEADLAAVSEFWRLPIVCSVGNRGTVQRNWIPQTFTWTAANLCHKPLYFENVQLERYGHSHGPFTQPVQSVAHFFTSLVTLPYQMSIHPANECQYALGYYRPGNCAPWLKDPIPISLAGAGRQALFVTGMSFIP